VDLKKLLYADSRVLEYAFSEGTVTIQFLHYDEQRLVIRLYGCTFLEEKGSIGIDLAGGKIREVGSEIELCLRDDDGLVFRALFARAEVRSA
jgi:hypothetical protein